MFWAVGINVTWQWRHNGLSSKSNFSPVRHFLVKCFTLRFLWINAFCFAQFHKNLSEEFRDILELLYKKGIIMHALKTGLNADKFATFGCFWKGFITQFVLQMTLVHSKGSWTQVHMRNFETHKDVWIRVKRNAELFLWFLRLLSRKQRLKQNSSIYIYLKFF